MVPVELIKRVFLAGNFGMMHSGLSADEPPKIKTLVIVCKQKFPLQKYFIIWSPTCPIQLSMG